MIVAIKDAGKRCAIEIKEGIIRIRRDQGGGEGVGVGKVHIEVGSEDKIKSPVFGVLAHIDELVGFGDLEGIVGIAVAVGVLGLGTNSRSQHQSHYQQNYRYPVNLSVLPSIDLCINKETAYSLSFAHLKNERSNDC